MAYTPRRVFHVHLAIIVTLAVINIFFIMLREMGHHRLFGLARLLNPGLELSIPTLFSVLALLVVALSAWAISGKLQPSIERRGWTIFAIVFAFLAVDEALQIHEAVSRPYGFAGTLIYAALAVPLGFCMFQFWLRQPMSVRIGILGAGFLYIVAAVFMELLELWMVRVLGMPFGSTMVTLNVAMEEFGEMLAVALFLRVFLVRYAMLGGGPLLPMEIRDQEMTQGSRAPAPDSFAL